MRIDDIEKLNEFDFPDATSEFDSFGDSYPLPVPSTKNLVHIIDKINEMITTINILSDVINNYVKN